MKKEELIKLFNDVTNSKVYTLEEKIKLTNQILKEIENIDKI